MRRLTAFEAARLRGVGLSTWRAYVSRGQVSEADGHWPCGCAWWWQSTVELGGLPPVEPKVGFPFRAIPAGADQAEGLFRTLTQAIDHVRDDGGTIYVPGPGGTGWVPVMEIEVYR